MSLGKLPAFKGLVSGSQGRRRFKSDLSVDMISSPMADFRHTMHVGRGGDVFGDTSFLSNYGGVREPESPDSANSSKTVGFFTRTFRHVRKNSVPRPRGGSRDLSSPPPEISPIIKNAISLPQLNMDSSNGCLHRMAFPSSVSSTDGSFGTYGLQSGFVTLPRVARLDRSFQQPDVHSDLPTGDFAHTRSDSLTSFTLDLGPSLMSEVLSLIDNPGGLRLSDHSQVDDEQEGEESEEDRGSPTPVQSPVVTSHNPSPISGSLRSSSSGGEGSHWTEQEVRRSAWSPGVVMEAERFQRAADVLARHYGGGSVARGTRTEHKDSEFSLRKQAAGEFSEEEEEEEEEEIKV